MFSLVIALIVWVVVFAVAYFMVSTEIKLLRRDLENLKDGHNQGWRENHDRYWEVNAALRELGMEFKPKCEKPARWVKKD